MQASDWLNLFGQWFAKVSLTDSKSRLPKAKTRFVNYLTDASGREIVVNGKKILSAAAYLLSDQDPRIRDRMGGISTWYVVSREAPKYGIVITLDNLADIRIRLLRHRDEKAAFAIFQSIEFSHSMNLTHRVTINWVARSPSRNRLIFFVIDALDLNLNDGFSINKGAEGLVQQLARNLIEIKPVPHLTWEERVRKYSYLETIQYLAPRFGCKSNGDYRRICRQVQKVIVQVSG